MKLKKSIICLGNHFNRCMKISRAKSLSPDFINNTKKMFITGPRSTKYQFITILPCLWGPVVIYTLWLKCEISIFSFFRLKLGDTV